MNNISEHQGKIEDILTVGIVIWGGTIYNYFEDCLESIKNQTINNFKIHIIVNGNITNEVEEILKKYGVIFGDRISIYRTCWNFKLAPALNISILLCKSKYYARMDDDDICIPERFKIQLDYLENNKTVLALGGSCFEFDTPKIDMNRKYPIVKVPNSIDEIKRAYHYKCPIIHPTVMFRWNFFIMLDYITSNFPMNRILSYGEEHLNIM